MPLLVVVGLVLVLRSHFLEARIRLELRQAMGVTKGDDGYKPHASFGYELTPTPPEVLTRLQRAPRESVERLMLSHFESLASEEDWHIMDDRTTLRRLRVLDLATSLGVVSIIRPQLEEIQRRASVGAAQYRNLMDSRPQMTGETTGVAVLRDQKFRNNALSVERAVARLIR
jgi:hypothetical protein